MLEVCVQLETFRNIDLYQQGLYRLKISCRSGEREASPYDISLKLSPKVGDPHYIDPARLSAGYAESRAFLMRYCNEEVNLKEFIYFQIKVPRDQSVDLKFELMFNDLNGKVKCEDISDICIKDLEMKSLNEFEVKLEYPTNFKSKFIPVLFNRHVSLASCTVHYILLDYAPCEGNFGLANIFRDRSGSARDYVGSSETDRMYSSYMDSLVSNYHTLYDYYLQIIGRCINNEMRMSLERRCFPSCLKLPGPINGVPTTFSQRVASHNPDKIAYELIAELNSVGAQMLQLWKKMLEMINKNTRSIINILKDQYNVEMRNQISKGVIRKIMRSSDFAISFYNSCDLNQIIAENKRKENKDNYHLNDPVIIDEIFVSDSEYNSQNLNFSNIFVKSRKKFSELHLMVLVHGFQGSSKDMIVLRNEISTVYPYTLFLLSSCNENITESSIKDLGSNLALEVKNYITDNLLAQIGNISFIGHSLGGLIIRAAIPLLLDYSSKFHLLMTLSTPHLGVQEGSKLVRAGIWIMNYVRKIDSLCELKMGDSKNIENCLLNKLSLESGLDTFTHLALISSPQDSYSPHFSSRIEVNNALAKKQKILYDMAKSLLSGRQKLHRIDVDFKILNKSLDSFIGRAGHIEFLENRNFMKFLLHLHPEFFE